MGYPLKRRALQIAASLVLIGLITLVDHVVPHLNHTTVTLTMLMGVLGIAAKWGLLEAVIASAAAIASEAFFFYAPIYNFAIEDSQNWVAVAAFFVISVVASQLSAGARNQAREAIARQRELELLYELSQNMIVSAGADARQLVVEQTQAVFGFTCCQLRDAASGRVYRSGDGAVPAEAMLSVEAGGSTFGEIGWRCEAAVSPQAGQSIAHLAAVALDRARTQEAATRAEASRQGQELKSLLMDSVAHEFKTPLTSIRFGATVLQDDPGLKPVQRELVTVIGEEADRLDKMISEAIQTARLEAGTVQLQRKPEAVSVLVWRALERIRSRWQDRQIDTQLPDQLPLVHVDGALVAIAIAHLLDNACKYSQPDGSVRVEACVEGDAVSVAVLDRGPGIPEAEQRRVFDRFYRREEDKQVPGSGTGLTIASEIARLHNGVLRVENRAGGGCCFQMRLPVAMEVGE